MNLYVINKSFEVVDIIDTYTSLIWTTRYYDCGDFELYVSANKKLIDILRQDYFIVRENDLVNAMVIEKIQLNTDIENGDFLIVSGRCLKSLLYRRIIWTQTSIDAYIETAITRLLNDNVINPSDATRKITGFTSSISNGFTEKVTGQYTGDNLGETIIAICKANHIGCRTKLDLDNKKFIFEMYKGIDRSYNQSDNAYVVFSNDFENLLTTTYSNDKTNYSNVAKVAGEGEGTARKSIIVGEASGLDRYESFVDARDLSTNDGEIDSTSYDNILTQRGLEKLSETDMIESIDGQAETQYNYKFGIDYLLGDTVEVINEYGIDMQPRIIEVIESEDNNGTSIIPTFSMDV